MFSRWEAYTVKHSHLEVWEPRQKESVPFSVDPFFIIVMFVKGFDSFPWRPNEKNSPSSDYLGFKLALIFGNDKGWLSLAFVEVAKLLIVPALWKPLARIHSNSGSFACLADLKACARVLCDFINQPMESVRQFFSIGIIIGKWSCLLSEWIL